MPGGGIGRFVPDFIFIIMYFVVVRRKKRQQQQNLIASLKTGDRVMTNAGIHGLISNVKRTVLVKVADNVVEMDKSAIANVLKEG